MKGGTGGQRKGSLRDAFLEGMGMNTKRIPCTLEARCNNVNNATLRKDQIYVAPTSDETKCRSR